MKKEITKEESPLDNFRSYMKKKNMSENTITAYLISVRSFLALYPEITPENLKAYRSFLITRYRPATINQRIHAINFYAQYLQETHQADDPDHFRLHSIKIPRGSFQDSIISNEDCEKLEQGLKDDKNYFWYFVVRFLVTTGTRVSELTQIKVEHLSCGYVDLYSKGGKIRRIYITDALCKEALEWCASRGQTSGFLFVNKNGRPVTARGIHSQLKHYAVHYGINPDTTYPHSFRHRFAKNFLGRCGDIALLADILGHESIETTRIYLTRSSKEQKTLLDEIVTW